MIRIVIFIFLNGINNQVQHPPSFFRSRIDHMIDLRHQLTVLASRMPWQEIKARGTQVFPRKGHAGEAMPDLDLFGEQVQRAAVPSNERRPRVPLRIMLALLHHRHAFNESTTVFAMQHCLGIKPSYSRPRVSDDNAFVDSLFRTAKFRPEFAVNGFKILDDSRQWAARFVHWYSSIYRHSAIRYVSPAQRHAGEDGLILTQRHAVYLQARDRSPSRWSRHTRNWRPVEAVILNPERDVVVSMAVQSASDRKVLAA